jgi:ribosomal protein S3AE
VDPVIRDYLREMKRRKGDVQQVENVKIKDGTVEVTELL